MTVQKKRWGKGNKEENKVSHTFHTHSTVSLLNYSVCNNCFLSNKLARCKCRGQLWFVMPTFLFTVFMKQRFIVDDRRDVGRNFKGIV